MKYSLRDYQEKAKRLIQGRFSVGDKRVMAWLNTGAGKGLLMSDFNFNAIARGHKVLNIMRRREIIFQTIKNYKKYHGINASPIMGSLKGIDLSNPCQVASIDTLTRRVSNEKYLGLKDFSLIVIDECHDMTSDSYKRLIWFLEGLNPQDYNPKSFELEKDKFKKFYVGLTATPFRVGKKTHTFFQSVVKPIEAHELRDRGFLVPAKVYGFKKIDTSGLRIDSKTGDFDQKQVFERVSKLEVIGDVVNTYIQYGQNKPAICFCVNQQHSKIMADAFKSAGVPAIHCDADHSQEERNHAIAGLKSGQYKVLTNCNIFSTGFDAPWIEVEISARPTDSENLCVQQWGRVLRPYKVCGHCGTEYGGDDSCHVCGSKKTSYVKEYALIFDHANNTSRFGLPYDVRFPELEPIDSAKKRGYKGIGVKTCPKCFITIAETDRLCLCGHDFTQKGNQDSVNHVSGEIHEINETFLKERLYQKIKQKYNSYKRLEMLRNWLPNAKYYKLYEDFGDDLFEYCSEFGIPQWLKKRMQDGKTERTPINMAPENDKVYT
jgi:superfamily II DNA or RNA helicase